MKDCNLLGIREMHLVGCDENELLTNCKQLNDGEMHHVLHDENEMVTICYHLNDGELHPEGCASFVERTDYPTSSSTPTHL